MVQRLDSTNVGLTNFELVQMSDWDKCRTIVTNVEPVQMSDGYIYKEKRRALVEFERRTTMKRNKNHSLTGIKIKDK